MAFAEKVLNEVEEVFAAAEVVDAEGSAVAIDHLMLVLLMLS